MADQSLELRNRIIQLSDHELTQMVNLDRQQYREEALVYAEAEMQRRSLIIQPVILGDAGQTGTGDIDTTPPEYISLTNNDKQSTPCTREVKYKVFRSSISSWGQLFSETAEFASQVGPERLISISHSEDNNEGVVTVWYWA